MRAFKVLQFNMQFGQNWSAANPDGAPVNLDLSIEEIRSHDADIIFLQEVEHARPGGVQPDPPPNFTRMRAALPDYDGFFCYPKADPRELPFGIGQTILSKTPLNCTIRRDLPSPTVEFDFRGEKRTPTDRLLIGAQTTIAGRPIQVFNTHLLAFFMLDARGEEPASQLEIVVEQVREPTGPTLVGGDFNVCRHDVLVRQFLAAGYQTVQDSHATWRRRPYVLDHLFYNRFLRPLRYAVEQTPASDHHMLTAEFEFA